MIRQPLGVVAGITPFNFPAMVPMWMLPIAIACGNTSCSSPSEKDPLGRDLAPSYSPSAGCPTGVFNIVHGDKVAVDASSSTPTLPRSLRRLHPDCPVHLRDGNSPRQAGAGTGRRQEPYDRAPRRRHGTRRRRSRLRRLRIGGRAVHGDLGGHHRRRCRRFAAQRDAERIGGLTVGNGLDPDAEMGLLITAEHRDKVAEYVDKGIDEGLTWSRTARTSPSAGTRTGSSSVHACSTRSLRDVDLPGRDLRPGAERGAGWTTTRTPST